MQPAKDAKKPLPARPDTVMHWWHIGFPSLGIQSKVDVCHLSAPVPCRVLQYMLKVTNYLFGNRKVILVWNLSLPSSCRKNSGWGKMDLVNFFPRGALNKSVCHWFRLQMEKIMCFLSTPTPTPNDSVFLKQNAQANMQNAGDATGASRIVLPSVGETGFLEHPPTYHESG